MKKVILVRGQPGSGKTTIARMLWVQDVDLRHFEADMFFMVDGEYCFDAAKIKEAHKWCQDSARETLQEGDSVIVSNTFTQLWEMQPYIDMAKEYGATLQVIECKGDFGNVHNVPSDAIERMRARWEEYKV